MNNIIVTGGTGFLGSHLVKALIKLNYRVIILKLSTSPVDRVLECKDKIVFYDTDKIDLDLPFKEYGKIDAVIHCATSYGRNGEKASEMYKNNTLFPLELLEIAISFKTDVFFNTDTILEKYLNCYSISKKHFSEIGRQFSESGKIKFLNIKLEHMYGPGDDISKFTSYIIKSCIDNVPEIKLTHGDQKRDFIYIDDVVSAYITLLKKFRELNGSFCDFDLGSGNAVKIKDFVEFVHQITGSTSKLLFGAIPYRENEVMESKSDISILKSLGWSPRVSLKTGVEKTINEEFK